MYQNKSLDKVLIDRDEREKSQLKFDFHPNSIEISYMDHEFRQVKFFLDDYQCINTMLLIDLNSIFYENLKKGKILFART